MFSGLAPITDVSEQCRHFRVASHASNCLGFMALAYSPRWCTYVSK
jgi:hypothetical protein